MPQNRFSPLLSLLFGLSLGGCGLNVPSISEPWETSGRSDYSPTGLLEAKLKRKVYCEIIDAVKENKDYIPRDWAVQTTLDLQVDESGAVSPGIGFLDPLPNSQTISYNFGATASAQATHEDKFGSYWSLSRIVSGPSSDCKNVDNSGSSLLLQSDLGIKSWLHDALETHQFLGSSPFSKNSDPAFKQDALTYHTKFVVISSASFTPTWKLLRISANTSNTPLAAINRTRTHDLLMTFGPAFKPGTINIAANAFTAAELGIAVSNGNRTLGAGSDRFTSFPTTP